MPRHSLVTSEQRSRNMAACRRRDTQPELILRRTLHARGLRFRVDLPLSFEGGRARPDVVFTRARVAVFVDGCFWHGCPDHKGRPKSNTEYWGPKIDANRRRDDEQRAGLEAAGWTVIRVWEHDPAEWAAEVIESAVGRIDERRPAS